MSALIPNIICSSIISIMGLIVVRNISGSKEKAISFRSIVFTVLLIIISIFFHDTKYNYIYSILIYATTIITYKEILRISAIRSTISCGIMMIGLIVIDLIVSSFFAIFITVDQLRDIWYLNIIINIFCASALIFIFSRKNVSSFITSFVNKLEHKKAIKIVFAIIITLTTLYIIMYAISKHYSIDQIFTTNVLLFIVFFLLIIMLLGERNNYENLSDEYDNLFNYVGIFEDWIEREQLTRHEYKNQLAVIRSMTKEKKVKDKIDSIVDDFINIDNEIVTQLKNMPNGGLKGLLYYKLAISRKNNINIVVDIDEKTGKKLSSVSEDKMRVLTKLLGIYLDNAIEASFETDKKLVTLELYKLKDDIKIVVSNSYNEESNIINKNQKGVSTKGKGRGNGLYFASKLVSKNKWINTNQKTVDGFYIQELLISFKQKEKV